ncbi:nucleotide disphospho-sugar-binding domain-containing protein [Actinoplanes siamensis]|uniref:Glycosyl transferase n=1 Tax=Actinoplanes siamensis TaxID=1223317 RepID=A0A919N9K6_9ACTN|nr:nucleotide disphospho-sugar-binding domain-containing protein [Actinoplanes siamensis]GIF07033.1 glycosyl transferase [Actinoplanes siamensis]
MRVLFATIPHPTHSLQIVPYAQALQNAGHEVCVVTGPGGEGDLLSGGLAAVSFGEPVPLSLANWKKHGLLPSQEMRERFADAFDLDPVDRDHWDVFYQYYSLNARFFLPREHRADIDGMVEFAKVWKPDLVLWESWFPLGGVIARACGAAHARVLLGPDYLGWSVELFRERGNAAVAALGGNPVVEAVAPVAERHGLRVDDDLLLGQVTIDPLPEELRLSRRLTTLPVRGIPYHGGHVLPEWLHRRPERPRIAVSLGLSVRLWQTGGDTRVPKIMEAVEGLDVEVVATLSENQLASTPRVPDNVRVVEFVPLSHLLPTCTAIVYHGAGGTFRAAQAAGIPQMIIDTEEPHRQIFSGEGDDIRVSNADRHQDSWFCSKYITERGAGVRMNHQKQSAEEIRAELVRLLEDPAYRKGAATLRDEWLAKPSPAEIIPDLAALADGGERGGR